MFVAAGGLGMAKLIGVNDKGLRVGEDHQRAKLTDQDVERMRQLHEVDGIGYRRLCKMFEVSHTAVRRICNYEMRNQAAVKFRKA